MVGGGLGAYWFYEGRVNAVAQERQALQAYLSCDSPDNKTNCNLHVPISVNLALNVSVYQSPTNHTLIANRYLPHDLILNNFYLWLTAFLNNCQSACGSIGATLTNTAGSGQADSAWGTNSVTCAASSTGINCNLSGTGGLIEVGTVSTAAARTDSNLGAAYQTYFDTSSTCSAGSTDSVVVTGSENANTGTTITESGLFIQFNRASSTTTVMLAHDVFGGVVVSGGNTITVQYTWSLNNAGFNYNLCELLAAYWTQPNGASGQVKTPAALSVFFDTAGRNVTWYPTCGAAVSTFQGSLWPAASSNPTSSACVAWSSTDLVNAMQIAIGTGSASFTPTTRSLTSFYAQNYITNTNYDSAGNAYETANILLATGATISEAAIYLTLPKGCIGYSPNHGGAGGSCITSYGSDTIMLLAATFTGQAVPNGQSIGVTFQESG